MEILPNRRRVRRRVKIIIYDLRSLLSAEAGRKTAFSPPYPLPDNDGGIEEMTICRTPKMHLLPPHPSHQSSQRTLTTAT